MQEKQPARTPPSSAQQIIRIALFVSALSIGAVAWFLNRNGAFEGAPESFQILRTVFTVVFVTAAAALIFIRRRRLATKSAQQAAMLNIAGWGLAEGVALFGAIVLMVTGSLIPFAFGLLMMVVTFTMLPIAKG